MNFYTVLLRRLLFGRWSPVLMLAVSALSGSMALGSDATGSQVAPQETPQETPQVVSQTASQIAPQTAPPSYADFHTDDETNNIDIFKRASASVVNITNSRLVRSPYSLNPQSVPQGIGTGFVWGDEGYIVTNFHVVQQANRVTVTLQDGSTFDARAVGLDTDKDLAVLKIEAEDVKLVPVELGDSGLLEVGRKVIAIGNPFGLDTTMTVGIVSALGREIDSISQRKIRDVIQTLSLIHI